MGIKDSEQEQGILDEVRSHEGLSSEKQRAIQLEFYPGTFVQLNPDVAVQHDGGWASTRQRAGGIFTPPLIDVYEEIEAGGMITGGYVTSISEDYSGITFGVTWQRHEDDWGTRGARRTIETTVSITDMNTVLIVEKPSSAINLSACPVIGDEIAPSDTQYQEPLGFVQGTYVDTDTQNVSRWRIAISSNTGFDLQNVRVLSPPKKIHTPKNFISQSH